MAMASGGADFLLQRPWLPVNISGRRLLIKSWFKESEYELLLTDLRSVWTERMEAAAIHRRAQDLNRRLRAPVEAFFSHLCEVVQPYLSSGGGGARASEAEVVLTREDGGHIILRLKSELAGLPFYWEFHCSPAPITLVCDQLVRPLLSMSQLLQQQVQQLQVLLVRKDSEIQDYRENGATLSRERLQTDVYEEDRSREEFMMEALPRLFSDQRDSLGFSADLQRLYAAVVVARGNACKRKLSEEKEQLPTEEPDLATSSGDGSISQSAESSSEEAQVDATGAKMADRPSNQQIPPLSLDPADHRTSSKPKKKKVGLFR